MGHSVRTRISLIKRVKNQDNHEAWKDFVHYYRPFIYSILAKMHISADDIDDLIQIILIKLWENLPNYEKRNAKFRTWLSTVIRNCSYDFFRKEQAKTKNVDLDQVDLDLFSQQKESELELKVEKEWKTYITGLAMEKIRKIFRGKAVNVFELSLKGQNADEIAQQLSITPQTVYTLKNRVKNHFMAEIKGLIEELEF